MKTWAFIQMRMNSSRLPRKPFALINGKSLIDRVYAQVSRSQSLDGIAFLSTINTNDEELETYYKKQGIPFYRGSENDIVDRFLQAANRFGADRIVRIWGDCPLVHHEVIKKMLLEHKSSGADMTSNSQPATFPFGLNVEIYNKTAFQRIFDSSNDPFFREFPIEFIKKDSSMKLHSVKHSEDLSSITLTIDYEADRVLSEKLYAELEIKYPDWSLADLIKVCKEHREWFENNQKLGRNIDFKEKMNQRNPSAIAGGNS